MLHTIYKITNFLNGKIYIGKHSCEDINDTYMGSGKLIKSAIDKYGLENFKKEIIHIFETEEAAYKMEKIIVNEDFIKRNDVYNLIIGGDSFESINSNIELRKEKNKRAAASMNKINWSNDDFISRNKERMSTQSKKLHSEGILSTPNWTGKKHKEESKRKIGEKNSETQKGQKNSQYGTCWIFNEKIGNRKIKKTDLESYLLDGWVKGRKIKNEYDSIQKHN
jgi:hypothetical protein